MISGGSAYRSEVREVREREEKKKKKRNEEKGEEGEENRGWARYSGSQESSDKCISISPYWRGSGRR